MFGKASAHLSEELRQGWRSLKILCRFGSIGLYVTTKGILFISCGSLLSLSASSLEVDVASRQIQTDLVVNLSNYELTEHEIAVLSKGLKFIPTPTRTNKTELLADIKKFGRRMRLKEFLLDQNDDQFNYTKVDLRKPPNFTPKPGRESLH